MLDVVADRSRPARSYWLPAVVCVLGVLSVALLLLTAHLHRRQRDHFAQADALMDLRVITATSYVAIRHGQDLGQHDDVRLREATHLAATLLSGGEIEHGLVVGPLDRAHHDEARRLAQLLAEFVGLARRPPESRTDPQFAARLDPLFTELQRVAERLEVAVEHSLDADHGASSRVLTGMLAAWSSVIVAAAAGLLYHERGRRRAEASLRRMVAELEQRGRRPDEPARGGRSRARRRAG